jgi:glutamyl-tRNA reductase
VSDLGDTPARADARLDAGEPSLVCIGSSHETASLAARERFAIVGARGVQLVAELTAHPDVLEVVPVATCNRSEVYLAVADVDAVVPVAVAAFARLAGADPEELSTMLVARVEQAAVEHLFRVAAGIESVIVGEAQIQGQLKESLAAAHAAGTTGPLLDRLFRHALEVGKQVRTDTGIGIGQASVGSVAAELVRQRLGDIDGRRVLVVGAGEMSMLAVRALRDRGAADVVVANRSPERAQAVATACDGVAVPFADLDAQLALCDVVISSTSAPHAVVTVERLAPIVEARGGRPMTLLDLAVPRDIEPGVGELPGCHLFDLDDLEHVVATNIEGRTAEVAAAEGIVDGAAMEFGQWRRERTVGPAIAALRARAEVVRVRELERFDSRLAHLAPEDRRRIEQLTRSIVNKLLHEPSVRLREAAGAGADTHAVLAGALEQLLGPVDAADA